MKKPTVKFKDKEKHELMITNKSPLKNICKNNDLIIKINDSCILVNKIIIQTYQFINLYLLHLYENNLDFPILNIDFIKNIIKTITIRNDTRGKQPTKNTQEILTTLKKFYTDHYKHCILDDDIMNDTKLNYIMAYEVIDIVKNINNNISEHFVDYVNKFVNVSFDVKKQIINISMNKDYTDIQKKEKKKEIYDKYRLIKKDILRFDDKLESSNEFHEWIKLHKPNIIKKVKIFKNKKEEQLKTNKVEYDVCVNPQNYIKSMFYINKELEKINDNINKKNIEIRTENNKINNKNKKLSVDKKIKLLKEEKQIKLYQVIPQRTSIKSKYITIDTSALINLSIKKDSIKYLNDIEKYKEELWKTNFKINKREFKRRNYIFNGMIKTDGIGCSILLVKSKDGKPINITPKLQREYENNINNLDKYIEDIEITDEIKKKRIVCLDPGNSDIFYAVSKNIEEKKIKEKNNTKIIKEEKILTFRYTQNQRRLETRNKKYNKIQDKINKETIIDNKNVKCIETDLSIYNSKYSNYNKYKEYCKKKNEINRKLNEHYNKDIFRKLKFNRYINTQKSESKMIKNFRKKFGTDEECIVILGDYDKGDGHMKGKEPIINRRIRKIFRNNKYEVYLINEYNTSKLCNKCDEECKPFLIRESKNPKHNKEKREVWGLTLCTNKKCKLIHNRDKNAGLNMYKIVESIYKNGERPKKYKRTSLPLNDGN
jgi:uncharacterized membrane protein